MIQTDGAAEMQLLLLTVGLALACGLQAQGEDHEQEELDPQGGLLEVTGEGLWGPAAPRCSGAGDSFSFRAALRRPDLSERHGRWAAWPPG